MDHLAIPVRDQERARRLYETYFGFGGRPARRHDDGVLMLYDDGGFALALGPSPEPIARPAATGRVHRRGVMGARWPLGRCDERG